MKTFLIAIFMTVVVQVVSIYPTQETYPLIEPYDHHLYLEEHGYNPYHGREVVDSKGRYILEWLVNYKTKMITFKITCNTTGWVGLGFSKDGKMKKADLMIGGVRLGGQPYLADMYAESNRNLNTDAKQDWVLVSALEIHGTTFLQVTRPFDSCDPFDYPITTDLLWVIWAFGETDDIDNHFDKRGNFRVYLLDPIIQTQENPLQLWELRNTVTLSAKRTTYVCTIHRAPIFTKKHHMVEIHAYLENQVAVQHTHHMVLYRCTAPPGFDTEAVFEPWTSNPGEECYFGRVHNLPSTLCKLCVTVWAIGGNPLKLPQSIGFPLAESPAEYYLLEIHYNNPIGYSGVTFTSGLDIYYTEKLRPQDGGALFIFSDPFGLFIVPPISTGFDVYAYCTPNCTKTMLPESGIEILGLKLHGHNSAAKITLQHLRKGNKLDVIMKDDNYDSTFQQFRILYEPRLVLPGDQLVLICEHDNTWTNTTTVTGFATFEEMCNADLILNKRVPYFVCSSQIPQETLLPLIGVDHVEWDLDTEERVITSPATLASKPLKYVLDELINWDKSLRYRIREVTLNGRQIGMCPQVLAPPSVMGSQIGTHESMKGIMITHDVEPEHVMTMATGYGTETLMGPILFPTRMPGPISFPIQQGVRYYTTTRSCPRMISPFTPYHTAAVPIGNSFAGQVIRTTAQSYYQSY